MHAEHHSVIVIGSGFGGAVTAARLVEAGVKVTLLERGPWRDSQTIRQADIPRRAPFPAGWRFFSHLLRNVSASGLPGGQLRLHHDGLFDIHLARDMSIVCSSGVGGGSHVYSAMNVRPAVTGYWDNIGEQISHEIMEPHYRWILERMHSQPASAHHQPVPNAIDQDTHLPDWMNLTGVQQPAYGFRFAGPDKPHHYQSNSFLGSADNQKVTLDEALLLPLTGKGLTVRDRHEVLDIARTPEGFRLRVHDHQARCVRTLLAPQVVLAAGTLNTLKLLFACRQRGSLQGMPALGLGIGGNGDVPAYWPTSQTGRDLSCGTPCHGHFNLKGVDQPAHLSRCGLSGLDDIPMPASLRRRLKQHQVLIGMGADEANGIAGWRRNRLRLTYQQLANPVLHNIYRDLDQISALSGQRVYFLRQWPLTVHPLGGARMGTHKATSVVNQYGEVHDIPGLFITDASALPAAPGGPPSMTIAAWAGHVATQWLAHAGQRAA